MMSARKMCGNIIVAYLRDWWMTMLTLTQRSEQIIISCHHSLEAIQGIKMIYYCFEKVHILGCIPVMRISERRKVNKGPKLRQNEKQIRTR